MRAKSPPEAVTPDREGALVLGEELDQLGAARVRGQRRSLRTLTFLAAENYPCCSGVQVAQAGVQVAWAGVARSEESCLLGLLQKVLSLVTVEGVEVGAGVGFPDCESESEVVATPSGCTRSVKDIA